MSPLIPIAMLASLAGCGTLTPAAKNFACEADKLAPAAVKVGGAVATMVDSANAPIAAAANAVDAPLHEDIQEACK
jgi:hypothetical protein